MKNIDYLQQIDALQDLYRFCNAAEEVQQTDYDSCGWNCRKALEWMVRAVYKLERVSHRGQDILCHTGVRTFCDSHRFS